MHFLSVLGVLGPCNVLCWKGQGTLFLDAVPQHGPEGSLHPNEHPVGLPMWSMKADWLGEEWDQCGVWGIRCRGTRRDSVNIVRQRRGWVLAGCSWGCRALFAPFFCSAWDVISPGTYLPSSWSRKGNFLLLVVVILFDQESQFFSSVSDGSISTLVAKV